MKDMPARKSVQPPGPVRRLKMIRFNGNQPRDEGHGQEKRMSTASPLFSELFHLGLYKREPGPDGAPQVTFAASGDRGGAGRLAAERAT